MSVHDIFVESHHHYEDTQLVVQCSCGSILFDGDSQLDLDDICQMAWDHRELYMHQADMPVRMPGLLS